MPGRSSLLYQPPHLPLLLQLHRCAKAVGRRMRWCLHLGLPIRGAARSWAPWGWAGAHAVGRWKDLAEGAWGGAEGTTAGAPWAPWPSAHPKCCYLCLEHSSLPLSSLIFRGWFYSSFWSQLRLHLITSSRKPPLPPSFRCPSSALGPGILTASSPCPSPSQLGAPQGASPLCPQVAQLPEHGRQVWLERGRTG